MENIKINDLRIGSLVKCSFYKGDETYFQIRDLFFNNTVSLTTGNVQVTPRKLKDIKPILIAEELITKTQLYLKWSSCHRGKYAMFEIDGRLYYYYTDTNTVEPSGSSQIYRYFHELQNLYYALTKNELIVSGKNNSQ